MVSNRRWGRGQDGFSLVELVTVMIIASIIFIYMGANSAPQGLQLQASRDDVIQGLFYAQQIAMSRQTASNTVRFVSDGVTEIDVEENGVSVGGHYPLELPVGHSLSAATFVYDKLGRTTAGNMTLAGAGVSVNIVVESSGYAH